MITDDAKMKKDAKRPPVPWKRNWTTHEVHIPLHFQMLCQLCEVDPAQVLDDFMNNLGVEIDTLGYEPEEAARFYFQQCGYGRHYYSPDMIQQMLFELKALSAVWPKDGSPALRDKHLAWRRLHNRYWFKKWFEAVPRKATGLVEDDEDV